ncbi:citrate lyase beta subunit [Paraburkholderia atlantica]|uniref:Citrate lyase beta subunit n=3 Tax=Paraburkholderia TaxID=1822464 RepID=A0A7W8LGG5_9BURK|nr:MULTISPECIES: HpcH/HpaI aldolase/citrate lyase family protein [Paraburkholderia]MBB5405326.1 citrate lyase beta subunit [Paraburkholderia youngii]MBB5429541.1 citrate lyase beta subunit [Paraburkholderia atlantica]
MPATRGDMLDVVFGTKISELCSLVVCLEDAVAAIDVESALANLRALLMEVEAWGGRPEHGLLLLLRPHDAAMAAVLSDWPLMKHVDRFVVPKLTLKSLQSWEYAVSTLDLCLMPTPETVDAFDPGPMVELGQALKANPKSAHHHAADWRKTSWVVLVCDTIQPPLGLETLVASRLARF